MFVPETRSHFRTLLDDPDLLDRFIDEDEDTTQVILDSHDKKRERKRKDSGFFEPEEAYLGIASNIRMAIKKHLPWVRESL